MDEFAEIVAEFLVESYKNLDQLDRDLLELEQDPSSHERLSSIFRTIHTIKGTSGFLSFTPLEELSHIGENLLAPLRDGQLTLTQHRTDVLLSLIECLRTLLAEVESTGNEGSTGAEEIRSTGGRSIVQDKESSAGWGMPGIVARAGSADQILPLPAMATAVPKRIHSSPATLAKAL